MTRGLRPLDCCLRSGHSGLVSRTVRCPGWDLRGNSAPSGPHKKCKTVKRNGSIFGPVTRDGWVRGWEWDRYNVFLALGAIRREKEMAVDVTKLARKMGLKLPKWI